MPAPAESVIRTDIAGACYAAGWNDQGDAERKADFLINYVTTCVLTLAFMPGDQPNEDMDMPAFLLGIEKILETE